MPSKNTSLASALVTSPPQSNWQMQVKQSLNGVEALAKYCQMALEESAHSNGFSVRVTHEYADKIIAGDTNDPLLRQVLLNNNADLDEPIQHDVVGDQAAQKTPALIQKYHGRVLLLMQAACPIHCQYCFRQHLPYADIGLLDKHMQAAMNYIAADASIGEVILSGGEPLLSSNAQLQALFNQLESIAHLSTVRIHSRILSCLSARVDQGLCQLLASTRLNVVFVNHINHPNELDHLTLAASQKLRDAGCQLLNQSVLLKNCNDSADTLITLSHQLFAQGILPYYLHQLDRISGVLDYAVSMNEASSIVEQMREKLPGYLMPRWVTEVRGEASKRPLG